MNNLSCHFFPAHQETFERGAFCIDLITKAFGSQSAQCTVSHPKFQRLGLSLSSLASGQEQDFLINLIDSSDVLPSSLKIFPADRHSSIIFLLVPSAWMLPDSSSPANWFILKTRSAYRRDLTSLVQELKRARYHVALACLPPRPDVTALTHSDRQEILKVVNSPVSSLNEYPILFISSNSSDGDEGNSLDFQFTSLVSKFLLNHLQSISET